MEGKKRILFIINPISGVGKKNVIPPLIEDHLNLKLFDFEIQYTKHRGHGAEIAKENLNKFDVIVAVGGDGSVNEIGGALVNEDCALGIIPCGSGNGLARHLNIPLKLKNAVLRLNDFNPIYIDTGTVNDHVFLGTCGFGIDAHIAKKFDEHYKRGFFSYARLVIREFKKYECPTFEVRIGKKSFEKTAIMCSVANSSQFGNGFLISPRSELRDGIFELILLEDFKGYHLPSLAYRFFTGNIPRSSKYESYSFETIAHIRVKSNGETYFHVDGEPLTAGNEFEIKLNPASLKVL